MRLLKRMAKIREQDMKLCAAKDKERERARKKYDAIPEMARDYIDAFDDERNSHNA